MIRATCIASDVPELGLHARDVVLEEEEAQHQAVLYRPLPVNYKLVIPLLIAQGLAMPCSLADADDLLSVPSPTVVVPVLRSGVDRRQRHLKLVGESP